MVDEKAWKLSLRILVYFRLVSTWNWRIFSLIAMTRENNRMNGTRFRCDGLMKWQLQMFVDGWNGICYSIRSQQSWMEKCEWTVVREFVTFMLNVEAWSRECCNEQQAMLCCPNLLWILFLEQEITKIVMSVSSCCHVSYP